MRPAHVLCDIRLQRAQSNYSVFKVREVCALTNQLGNFFDFGKVNFRFFKNISSTAFQVQKTPYHITRM